MTQGEYKIPVRYLENAKTNKGTLYISNDGLFLNNKEQIESVRKWDWEKVKWSSGTENVSVFLFFKKREIYYEIYSTLEDRIKIYVENKYKNELEAALCISKRNALAKVNKNQEKKSLLQEYQENIGIGEKNIYENAFQRLSISDEKQEEKYILNNIDKNIKESLITESEIFEEGKVEKEAEVELQSAREKVADSFRLPLTGFVGVIREVAKQKQEIEIGVFEEENREKEAEVELQSAREKVADSFRLPLTGFVGVIREVAKQKQEIEIGVFEEENREKEAEAELQSAREKVADSFRLPLTSFVGVIREVAKQKQEIEIGIFEEENREKEAEAELQSAREKMADSFRLPLTGFVGVIREVAKQKQEIEIGVFEEENREKEAEAELQSAREKVADSFRLPLTGFVCVVREIAKQKHELERKLSNVDGQVQADEEMHRDGGDIIFLGKSYSTQKALAEDFGIAPATFSSRLNKGWTCKQALGFEEYIPPKVYFQGMEYESEKDLAEAFGNEFCVYKQRLSYGWTQEEALGIIPRKKPEVPVHKITYNGREYGSERELADAYGVKYAKYKRRLRYGWTREEALEIVCKKDSEDLKEPILYDGEIYNSERALAEAYGITYTAYRNRILYGWTQEEALGIVSKKKLGDSEEKVLYEGREYESERELAQAYGVRYLKYKRRLQHGWTREEALEIVPRNKSEIPEQNCIHDDQENKSENEEKYKEVAEPVDEKQYSMSGVFHVVPDIVNVLGEEDSAIKTEEEESGGFDKIVSEEEQTKLYEYHKKNFLGEYYDEFVIEWTKITKELLKLKTEATDKKISSKSQNSQRIIKPRKSSFLVSRKLLYPHLPERKTSLTCELTNEIIPWTHARSFIKELSLEYSHNGADYTIEQITQIQNLLFYLRYATIGNVDTVELASLIEEVYEWLCLNIGYNKTWENYSITEYAGELYDEITELNPVLNENEIRQISHGIVQLISMVSQYIDIDIDEEINRYFSEECGQQEECEPDNFMGVGEIFEVSSDEDAGKNRNNEILSAEKINRENTSEETVDVFEYEQEDGLYRPVDQADIIQQSPFERTVVNAGPGTGKTWTLIEKIKYLLVNEQVDPEGILVLCFSRAAVEVIRTRLSDASERGELPVTWSLVDVRTFDSFGTYMIAWVQENMPELLPTKYVLESEDYEMRIKTAREVLDEYPDMMAQYEHIFVDEVQDLVGNRAELVLSLLNSLPETCGFTLFGDSCQALYDYLAENDDSVMTSDEFYRCLLQKFSNASFCSLKKNHRQGNQLARISLPYRNAILSGNSEECVNAARALYDAIQWSDIDLKHMSREKIDKYTASGTLGILTRTNGQALQISSWMKNKGIKHILQKPGTSKEFAGWIALVFQKAESDVIEKSEFISIFSELYPEKRDDAASYWYAITDTQRGHSRNHYEIESLLKGILQNAKNPLLYEEPFRDESAVTVSNIHRAKGREFDTVILLNDIISSMAHENSDIEHKVCYVAVTRPRKELEKVSWSSQYIYISRDEQRRCFKTGRYVGRNYLSQYEIGDGGDFNSRTFGATLVRQNIIRSAVSSGKRLKLLKCAEGTENYVVYKIVLETDEYSVLGYTSPQFAEGVKTAVQRVFHTYRDISFKYYPDMFVDIYIDGLTTCISANGDNIKGARQFGNMYLWTGLSASGFARVKRKNY